MKTLYAKADKYLAYLKRLLRHEFNRFLLLGFDELTVIRVKREISGAYETISQSAKARMLILAKEAYEMAAKEVLGSKNYETDYERLPNSAWLAKMLKQYNRTTGYLYESELDRKRLRLQEGVLTAREYLDRTMYSDCIKKSASLLWGQIDQYMIIAIDEARNKAFEDLGVEHVMWNSLDDEKTCGDCREREGQVYRIDKLPAKHYGCRCYLTPVK